MLRSIAWAKSVVAVVVAVVAVVVFVARLRIYINDAEHCFLFHFISV